jgi:hypothetical protein
MTPKRYVLTAAPMIASVVFMLSMPGTSGATAPLKSCKSPGPQVAHIQERGTTCPMAIKVIEYYGREKVGGFQCKTTGKVSRGVKVTCKHNSAEILYDVYEE